MLGDGQHEQNTQDLEMSDRDADGMGEPQTK